MTHEVYSFRAIEEYFLTPRDFFPQLRSGAHVGHGSEKAKRRGQMGHFRRIRMTADWPLELMHDPDLFRDHLKFEVRVRDGDKA